MNLNSIFLYIKVDLYTVEGTGIDELYKLIKKENWFLIFKNLD